MMQRLKLDTYINLCEVLKIPYSDIIQMNRDKVQEVPFYGELYQMTYNKQDQTTYVGMFQNLIEEHNTKTHLEVFSGTADESFILAKKYPNKKFTAYDIDVYYNQHKQKNLKYELKDCVTGKVTEKFDMIFVGTANASHCCININDLNKHFQFCANSLNKGGIFVSSYFECEFVHDNYFDVSYTTSKNGRNWVHWVTINRHNRISGSHTYYDMAIVCKDEWITEHNVVKILYCAEGKTFYSHNTATLINVAKNYGLEYIIPEQIEPRFCTFKKVS